MLPLLEIKENPVARSGSHEPVLLRETVDLLEPRDGATLVDATLGAGGHAAALLEAIGPRGRLLGIDRDPHALSAAGERLAEFGPTFTALRGNHDELLSLLHEAELFAVDGILFDLGLSSLQLDDAGRGFSFRYDGPLDMRMDPSTGRTAAQLLATCTEEELRRILRSYGEERMAGAIAREVVRQRDRRPLTRTGDLAELVERVLGPRAQRYRIHPATRTFQALRVAVNGEIDGLAKLITDAVSVLRRGGRVAAIAYHSLEDRAIKHTLKGLAQRCSCPPDLPVCGCGKENLVRIITSKPVRPTQEEIDRNPRSRSAKLRVAERL
jgi:16S rRNA (cytosine1402-N4)-methyltransferase